MVENVYSFLFVFIIRIFETWVIMCICIFLIKTIDRIKLLLILVSSGCNIIFKLQREVGCYHFMELHEGAPRRTELSLLNISSIHPTDCSTRSLSLFLFLLLPLLASTKQSLFAVYFNLASIPTSTPISL